MNGETIAVKVVVRSIFFFDKASWKFLFRNSGLLNDSRLY